MATDIGIDVDKEKLMDAAGALRDVDTGISYPATQLLADQVNIIARRWEGGDIGEIALARYEEDYFLLTDLYAHQIYARNTEQLRNAVLTLLYDNGEWLEEDVEIVDEEGWEFVQEWVG